MLLFDLALLPRPPRSVSTVGRGLGGSAIGDIRSKQNFVYNLFSIT